MTSSQNTIELAAVGRPHGVHGDLHLWLHNPQSSQLDSVPELTAQSPNGQSEQWTVVSTRRTNDKRGLIVRVREISDRSMAEQRKGWTIVIDRDVLPKLEADEFYYYELVDANVVTEAGVDVGRVVQVIETSNEVLVVNSAQGNEVLLPVLKDVVLEIDRVEKRVVVANDAVERFG